MGNEFHIRRCYFCGETCEDVLEEHHIVPRSLGIPYATETITVCANCHKKLHKIYRVLFSYIEDKYNIKLRMNKERELEEQYELQSQLQIHSFVEARKRIETVAKIINELIEKNGDRPVPVEMVFKEAEKKGIPRERTEKILNMLLEKASIYQPSPNTIMKVY